MHKQEYNDFNQKNKANKKGRALEDRLENILIKNNIPHTKQKGGGRELQIDFQIHINQEDILYVECNGQDVEGSVEEKVPHKVWKYYDKYKYDEVFLILGKKKLRKSVSKHLKELEDVYDIKIHLMTLDEFCEFLKLKNMGCTKLEEFMV